MFFLVHANIHLDCQKDILINFKMKVEMIYIISNPKGIKLETSNGKLSGKSSNIWT